MTEKIISFAAKVLRKQPDLPRYIVIKPEYLSGQNRSFPAYVSLNNSPPFSRNVQPWGKGSSVFFFNLTEPQCQQAGVDTGDTCSVRIEPHP